MISSSEISEIREHLENAKNPLFFYDNDADGLCSFLLLRRFLGRGKGVAVRSFPDLNASYARKARELNSDYVFVLDKPVLSEEFVREVEALGLPLVWIDHHDVPSADFKAIHGNFFKYNSFESKKNFGEPVTYICYKITERKEDLWVAMVGCIADHFLPDFSKEFAKEYPEFWGKGIEKPFDAYFGSEIGRIAQGFNFGLKDSVSNVVRMQNFLVGASSPSEIFAESSANYFFRKKYSEIRKKYDSLLERAKGKISENLIFFEYGGELSISSDLSNELSYSFPGKYVAVAFVNGHIANISLRGKGIKKILERVLKEVPGSGGGHEDAVGARISTGDLQKFREILMREISK